MNKRPFTRSAANPDANGHPHWDNGAFHLYFAGGHWRLQSRFCPDSNACWSFTLPSADASVPEGSHEWTSSVEGAWIKTVLTVQRLGGDELEGGGEGGRRERASEEAEGREKEEDKEQKEAEGGGTGEEHLVGSAKDVARRDREHREAEAEAALEVSGHFMAAVNAQLFRRSVANPVANGRAHYENGAFHLYFAGGCWRLQSTFDPASNACWSFIAPDAETGGVPRGAKAWTSFVEGAWRERELTVTAR